jgi:hypothetical protein
VYFEAWEVGKDDVRGLPHIDDTGKPKPTDKASGQLVDGTCGSVVVWGEVRFFAKVTTKDIGGYKRQVPGSRWRLRSTFGEEPWCVFGAGDIPATKDQPMWWDKPIFSGAKRHFTLYWDCCPGRNKRFYADASPRGAAARP